jgi:hypothetical protein
MSNEQLEELPVPDDSQNKPICTFSNMTDPRMLCKNQLDYSVYKGATNVTAYSEKASSASASGLNFNVNVPTMSTIVDRVIYLRAGLNFKVTGGALSGGKKILEDGQPTLAPFPFQSMCSSIQMTVNNQSFSWSPNETMGMITRMLDDDVLRKYGSLCPTQLDKYQKYIDIDDADVVNNPFAFYNTYNGENPSRRAFLNYTAAVDGTTAATFSVNIVEPIVISPLLLQSCEGQNSQGMYGINNLKFLFQLKNGPVRGVRFKTTDGATPSVPWVVTLDSIDNEAYLDFQFLSPPASVSKNLSPRNLVPYMDLNLQKTLYGSSIAIGGDATITTQSFQLSVIPDKVFICVRKRPDSCTSNDADFALPIKNVQINFANRNGILSGVQPHQLCQMSIESGVNTNWLEFRGKASKTATSDVATCGSYLCLEFAKHLNITEDYYSAGSLGQFQFYMNLTVNNHTGALINADTYEVALLFMNSGFLVNELGSSSVVVGVLTKDQVLTTSNEPPVNWDNNRMIGGAWYSGLKSAWRKTKKYIKPIARATKIATGLIPHPYAQMTSKALGAMGAGYSAGSSLRDRLM